MVELITFGEAVNYLYDIGVYHYFLPFLLVFAIVFAILEKTKVLGTDKRNINVIVSLVIGLLLIVQQGIVAIINAFLPRVSLILVVVLMALVCLSLLAGKEYKGLTGSLMTWASILVLVALAIALFAGPETGTGWLSGYEVDSLLRVGIPIIAFLGAIWLVTSNPKSDKEKEADKDKRGKIFVEGMNK